MQRVGIVGKRGLAYKAGISSVPGVEVTHFCDLDPTAERRAKDQGIDQFLTSFDRLITEVDAVVIATPMHLHASQSLAAMAVGKAVLCEVTAAVSTEECRALKSATGLYFFAENYCYFEQNLIAKQLVKQGRFGKVYYGEGDYIHEVRFLHRNPDGSPTWRMDWQVGSRGNTYCTHELGPLMQMFRAQDPSTQIASVTCFGSGTHTDPSLRHDDSTLTLLQLSNGGLIKLRLDMVSNRPHGVGYELQGVNGIYQSRDINRFWFGENKTVHWDEPKQREWADMDGFKDVLSPEVRKEIEEAETHGHGGSDYLVGRRFSQALVGERDVEITKQDAVEWTMVGLLSQRSIAEGSVPVPMPEWVYAQ